MVSVSALLCWYCPKCVVLVAMTAFSAANGKVLFERDVTKVPKDRYASAQYHIRWVLAVFIMLGILDESSASCSTVDKFS